MNSTHRLVKFGSRTALPDSPGVPFAILDYDRCETLHCVRRVSDVSRFTRERPNYAVQFFRSHIVEKIGIEAAQRLCQVVGYRPKNLGLSTPIQTAS